jgi:hypothetical protein
MFQFIPILSEDKLITSRVTYEEGFDWQISTLTRTSM